MELVNLLVLACVAHPGLVPLPDEPDPKELVRQVVAAAGGEKQILRIFRYRERLNVSENPEKPGSVRVSVVEPPGSWWIGGRERGPEPAKYLVWAWTLGAIVDPASRLEVLPEIEESGKKAVGLRVSETINPAMDLYFDRETHRLVRIDWRSDIHRFSAWKERDGLSYPSRTIGYKKKTGKPWYFCEILELERLEKRPDGLKP